MTLEEKLKELGLQLLAASIMPVGKKRPFSLVNVRCERVLFSGHLKQVADGYRQFDGRLYYSYEAA